MAEEKGLKAADRPVTKPPRSPMALAADRLIRAMAAAAAKLVADRTATPDNAAKAALAIAKALREAAALDPQLNEDRADPDAALQHREIIGRLARRAEAAVTEELRATTEPSGDRGSCE
jgi:hypothetical protein